MPKLPTVKLRRKRDGDVMIINQTQYARDVASLVARGYEIMSMRRGDATDEQIVADAVAAELEIQRSNDPAREKRWGDRQRAQDERAIRQNIVTETKPDEPVDVLVEQIVERETADAPETIPTWDEIRAMKWMAARWKVRDLCGPIPTSWEEAEELYRSKFNG